MNTQELTPFQRWRETQLISRKPYVPFEFCGHSYHVAVTSDGRRILIGEAAAETELAA